MRSTPYPAPESKCAERAVSQYSYGAFNGRATRLFFGLISPRSNARKGQQNRDPIGRSPPSNRSGPRAPRAGSAAGPWPPRESERRAGAPSSPDLLFADTGSDPCPGAARPRRALRSTPGGPVRLAQARWPKPRPWLGPPGGSRKDAGGLACGPGARGSRAPARSKHSF